MRIQYFVEAAHYENLSEAARSLFTSQPNLSKQIALLEQELGFPLFQRVGKSIHLTQAGHYLAEKFKHLPGYTAQAIAHAHALSRGDVGAICLGILEGQDISTAIADRLEQFRRQYPDIAVELERNSFHNLRTGLTSCRYDVILTLSFELEGLEGVCSQPILHQEGAIAISRKNPKADIPALTLTDLQGEPFVAISPEESPGGYQQLFAQCAIAGFQPTVARVASTLESMLLCVEAGIGVAILDRNTRLERNENVRTIPLPGSVSADVMAVWRADNRSPIVKRLISCLQEQPQ